MNIYTVNLNGITDIIETYESMIWNIQFFGKSDLQLRVPGTPKNLSLLQTGVMLVREEDIGDNEFQNVMIIENRQIDFDVEKGWILTVTGKGLKNILSRRVVWQQINMIGLVEDAIREVITQNVISPEDSDRTITDFTLATAKGYTDELEVQLFGENIADWLESIGQTFGIGWDVYIKNGKYVFTIKKGADRTFDQNINVPVVFSPEYDNLAKSTYRYNKGDYCNAALIGGEGNGVSQRSAEIGTATDLDRYEMYVDGQSVSSNGEIITEETYIGMLEDYGREELAKTSYITNIDGTIIPNVMYTINVDYFLGDLVQIQNVGISAKSRIVELIYSEDLNGTQIVPTFSDWEE